MVGKSQTKQRGLIATVFSGDGRQLQVDFLNHWAVFWLKLSGKSSL